MVQPALLHLRVITSLPISRGPTDVMNPARVPHQHLHPKPTYTNDSKPVRRSPLWWLISPNWHKLPANISLFLCVIWNPFFRFLAAGVESAFKAHFYIDEVDCWMSPKRWCAGICRQGDKFAIKSASLPTKIRISMRLSHCVVKPKLETDIYKYWGPSYQKEHPLVRQ